VIACAEANPRIEVTTVVTIRKGRMTAAAAQGKRNDGRPQPARRSAAHGLLGIHPERPCASDGLADHRRRREAAAPAGVRKLVLVGAHADVLRAWPVMKLSNSMFGDARALVLLCKDHFLPVEAARVRRWMAP
jgi:hypothetical protein